MIRSVLIIYTGGTIGMMEDPSTGELRPFDFEHLSSQIPELNKFDIRIKARAFERPIDSSDMHPSHWLKIAEMVAENYESFDGFVILHGSDTMAYTASALSFMLKNLAKPVILTGSQLPIGTIRTDGKENLITAIEIAGAVKKDGNPYVNEVAVYFEYNLLRGNRTSKVSANHFNAFQSGNYPMLAEAGVSISWNERYLMPLPARPFSLQAKLDSSVAILKLFPGIGEAVVNGILYAPGLKGVILETFGSGNATTGKWFIAAVEDAVKRGITIVNVTQCSSGSVQQGKYETSSAFNRIGVISGYDITTETAVTKLMFLLANSENIREDFTTPLAGEMTVG